MSRSEIITEVIGLASFGAAMFFAGWLAGGITDALSMGSF